MKKLTEDEMRDGANGLALALALGEVTKALERVANRLDKSDEKIDDMSHRLIRIEASSSSELAKESKLRIDVLEKQVAKNTNSIDVVKENRTRIEALEKEVSAWKIRFVTAGAVITAFWAFFGQGIQNFIAGVVHNG